MAFIYKKGKNSLIVDGPTYREVSVLSLILSYLG